MQLILILAFFAASVWGESAFVNLSKDSVVNVVSDEFISFSVDPSILINGSDFTNSYEAVCMGNALSPGFIRFAGGPKSRFFVDSSHVEVKDLSKDLDMTMTEDMMEVFLTWIQLSRLTPVFALDNRDRLESGGWNSSHFRDAMALVEKSGIKKCVWQLTSDCLKFTQEEYLNDLIVLKRELDEFQQKKQTSWKLASSDVLDCFKGTNMSKIISFLTESTGVLDAAVMNLDQLSDEEERKLVLTASRKMEHWKVLSLEDDPSDDGIVWLNNLGNAAKNGYSIIFKNLHSTDMKERTMSYYVSLLHKKFADTNVLDVEMEAKSIVSVFAQCARLPSGPIPNGILLYGANEGETIQDLVFNVTMETKGEVMQFILEKEENIVIINGKEITEENEMEADIIKVNSFRRLKVSLPPRSVGFWIVPNANIEACSATESQNQRDFCYSCSNMKAKRSISHDPEQIMVMEAMKNISIANLTSLFDSETLDDPAVAQAIVETVDHLASMIMLQNRMTHIGSKMIEESDTMVNASTESLKRVVRSLDKSDEAKSDEGTVSMSEIDPVSDAAAIEDAPSSDAKSKLSNIESRLRQNIQEAAEKLEERKMRLTEIGAKLRSKISPDLVADESKMQVGVAEPPKISLDDLVERARSTINLPKLKLDKIETPHLDGILEKARSALESIEPPKVTLEGFLEKARSMMKDIGIKGAIKTAEENDMDTASSDMDPKVSSPGPAAQFMRYQQKLKEHQLKFRTLESELKAKIAEANLKNKLRSKINLRTKRELQAENILKGLDEVLGFIKEAILDDYVVRKARSIDAVEAAALTWEDDIKPKLRSIDAKSVDKFMKDVQGFFADIKDKVKGWFRN